MNASNEDQKTKLVSALWELKEALKQHREKGIADVHFVHFNSLLKDENYRKEIISKALLSPVEMIRDAAADAQKFNLSGNLQGGGLEEEIRAAGRSQAEADSKRGRARWWVSGAAVAGLAAMGLVGANLHWLGIATQQRVSGSIYGHKVWSADRAYLLEDRVFVESGATLTIEAGTKVYGALGSALVVTRDGLLNARGTEVEPIVFTSVKPEGERVRGDWGGVVLLGNAPVNTGSGRIEGIAETDPRGAFGGQDVHANCGTLQYVRIEFAGAELSADNELNGLTLGGCGDSTVLRFVQVHMGLDDGIEFFGGTANLKNIVVSRAGDDALDWDRGWQGKGQFIVLQQSAEDGDNAIEADNLKADHDASPRSGPVLSNVTLVGSAAPQAAQRAMTLRRGTGGDFRNFIISGFPLETIDIRDTATAARIDAGELSFDSLLFADPNLQGDYFQSEAGDKDDDGGFDEAAYFRTVSRVAYSPRSVLPQSAYNILNPDFTPPANSPAAQDSAPIPQGEFWDEAANFRGAVRPGNRTNWLSGWTAFPEH